MAFNPELGSTSPAVLLDNAERLDKLVNGPAADVPDRGGDPLYSWRQMMAKNDEVRQNLIPLSKQYATLAAAQADIANIPTGSATYYRSPDDSALAIEVINTAGTLQPTGRKMPSQSSMVIGIVDSWVNNTLYPFDSLSSPNENSVSMNVAAVSTIAYREAYS
ncbi:SGNH/GDSL hydrolase family protein, partial [Klebsiella pneumoniae]|nr:SGNH/GDSL hydrolase family protein [Klebsiella pneumoniae]